NSRVNTSAMGSIALSWIPTGTFHHVGFVVPSIDAAAHSFAQSIGADWDGVIVHDPNQTVRVTFFQSQRAGDPLMELVEPVGDKSPVFSLAQRGGGLHTFVIWWIHWKNNSGNVARSAALWFARLSRPPPSVAGALPGSTRETSC